MNTSPDFQHLSVLLQESIHGLNPTPGKLYVDATLGGGGHSLALLEHCPTLQLIGIDQDPQALKAATERLQPYHAQFKAVAGNYSQLADILKDQGIQTISGGVLADLGVSSPQLDQAERGFSFRLEGPLDMRMNPDQGLTAADVVNTYSAEALVDILSRYGEVRFAKTIARELVQHREHTPFTTTRQLAQCIEKVVRRALKSKGAWDEQGKHSHPATQCFQAIRIEVNQELAHLERFLALLPELLLPGARLAIISFHSLEDRIVKHAFQAAAKGCVCPPRFPICQCGQVPSLKILTSKPITATDAECQENPRARSAKLRVAEKR
jgi:16S rRNA (cytosine1402-N4)-methyltransferase